MKDVAMLKVGLVNIGTNGGVVSETFNLFEINNNKISCELVEKFIVDKKITTKRVFGKLTTELEYKLMNGFTGTESTSCVDETNYSEEIGAEILLNRVKNKIWFGLGFALGMAQENK